MTTLLRLIMTWGLFLGTTVIVVRQFAVASGMYKDPLLAHFRRYGEEVRVYPVVNLLVAVGAWCFFTTLTVKRLIPVTALMGISGITTILLTLCAMSLGSAFLLHKQEYLRETLPVWYFEMLHTATREERRFIAYAWLRLPFKLRWRLNSDHRAFEVWADMVRIAFIYGAYDPRSTWDRWQ